MGRGYMYYPRILSPLSYMAAILRAPNHIFYDSGLFCAALKALRFQ